MSERARFGGLRQRRKGPVHRAGQPARLEGFDMVCHAPVRADRLCLRPLRPHRDNDLPDGLHRAGAGALCIGFETIEKWAAADRRKRPRAAETLTLGYYDVLVSGREGDHACVMCTPPPHP